MITNLFYITFLIVFITDISGVTYYIKKTLLKLLFKSKNPDPDKFTIKILECSLCQVWWCGIIYLLATQELSFGSLALVAVFSLSTSVLGNLVQLVIDICNTVIEKIYILLK